MAAKYPSTKETTNFARICRVLVGVVPDLLRHLLDTLLPGDKLKDKIKNTTAKKLQLNGSQKKILYPPDGFQGSVEDFDGTLLCLLIRNLEIDLDKDGRTVSANVHEHVDRLRVQCNEAYGHATKPSVSDEDFKTVWSSIRQTVDDLQSAIPDHKTDFVKEMDAIHVIDMDHRPRTVERYIKEFLEDMKKSLEEVKDIANETRDGVRETRDDVKENRDDVKKLESQRNVLTVALDNPSSDKSDRVKPIKMADKASTEESTNFSRICRVLVGVVPDLLRHLLVTKLTGDELKRRIEEKNPHNNSKKKSEKLKLNPGQYDRLYTKDGKFRGSLDDCDVSLLYILLRHLDIVDPHRRGWGKYPYADDRSVSANIDRLRVRRNNDYAHAKKTSVSDEDFDKVWSVIHKSVDELQSKHPDLKKNFVKEINDILVTEDLDPKTVERCKKEYLEDTNKSLQELEGNQLDKFGDVLILCSEGDWTVADDYCEYLKTLKMRRHSEQSGVSVKASLMDDETLLGQPIFEGAEMAIERFTFVFLYVTNISHMDKLYSYFQEMCVHQSVTEEQMEGCVVIVHEEDIIPSKFQPKFHGLPRICASDRSQEQKNALIKKLESKLYVRESKEKMFVDETFEDVNL